MAVCVSVYSITSGGCGMRNCPSDVVPPPLFGSLLTPWLQLLAAPTEAPKILSVVSKEDSISVILVSWKFDAFDTLQCSPDKGYRFVIYYQSLTDTKDKGVRNASDPGVMISSIEQLQPCTDYIITVAVINAVGLESPQSNPFNITTKSEKPSIAPTIKSVSRLKNSTTGLRVTWKFGGKDGLSCNPLLGYDILIYWWAIDKPDNRQQTNISDTSITSMDITGLTMCTEYNVSATARNFVGEESELSLPVTQATDTNDPEIPPKVTSVSIVPGSVTSLKVFWTFDGILDLSCDPAMNYNFEVGYFPVDKPRQLKTLLIEDESSSSFLIENLTTCTEYNVSMRVINFVGRGSPSSNSLLYVTSTDSKHESTVLLKI
ncbi:hypothetical protein BSL78_08992 [Apostichopus japonicus]|uniref:Fibronectin type-III domain-containing protein n=1 Tax=Stichopus japonicus TaxID=307972 RepID=A0A2G8L1H5_STIJA|nr:hypothetical protein BSL78_08992 [Apostichopus japonicus]